MKNTEIRKALEILTAEPNFDTFEASPNYHYFTDLCAELGTSAAYYSSYGDLLDALITAAGKRGVDVSGLEI